MIHHKILVAIDNSEQASKVFQEALDIANKSGSHLMLFHCIVNTHFDKDPIFIGTIGDVDMYSNFRKKQQKLLLDEIEKVQGWLQSYCQQANLRKVSAEFKYEFGRASKEICNAAKSWGADLIVLGRRGHKGLTEMLLGSVSNYVIHYAPCSVLIVQEHLPVAENKSDITTTA
jgi:nucleotide-binding universal stress UspA family protein